MNRLVIALLLCAPQTARAQEGGVDFFRSTLREIVDTPLLAASHMEELPSASAATAMVITRETIRKRGYESLADLLGDLPQFQVQRNSDVRRLNLVSVRGIPDNERILILYDGVQVSPYTGDPLAMAGQFSLRYAERVEVVLGPMSSVYGADAFSGVVNVVSSDEAGVKTGASYGSFDSRSGGFSFRTRRTGEERPGPSAAVAFHARSADNPRLPGFYRGDFAWYNNEYQAGLARLPNLSTAAVNVTGYDAREDSSFLNARLNLGDVRFGLVSLRESHSSSVGVKPEFTIYGRDSRFATGQWTFYTGHRYTSPGEDWKLSTLAAYSSYEISPESRFINSFSGYGDAYKYASSRTLYLEETLSLEPAEGTPLLLGLTYQDNSVLPYTSDLGHKFDPDRSPESQGFTYSGSTIPVDFHSLGYSNAGAFLRVQRRFGPAALSLGLRYDRNTSYGETWNPRAGLVWNPGGSEFTTVKLLYGEAYLAPSPFYSHKHFGSFVSSPTAASGYHSYFFHVPNEGLRPEKLRSAELSVSRSFGQALKLSLNPYYNKARDVIQDVVTGPGTFHGVDVDSIEKAVNSGVMETYGGTLRADASFSLGRWWLEPWAAYTRSEGHLAGDPIPFNSRHTLQSGVSIIRSRWIVTPKALYRSYSRNQYGARVPPFTVADLFVRYCICDSDRSRLSVWLRLSNVFDRRYYNAAYGGGADNMVSAPQDPFSAALGAEYRF